MEYTIKKGKHYSKGINFGTIFTPTFKTYNVTFAANCWHGVYDIEHSGINKLVGFTIGLFVHRNSIRIGWQPDKQKGRIRLYLYAYHSKVLHKEYLKTVDVNTDIEIVIGIFRNDISVTIDNEKSTFDLQYKNHYGFKCFPYFGGKSKAPHNMNIKII